MTEPQSSDRPPLPLMAALVGVTSLNPLGQTVIAPALPALAAAYGTAYGHAQLLITAYLAAMAAGQLVYGALSDRWGRRRLLLLGTGLYAAGSFASLLADSMNELLVWRALQAAGGCAGVVLGRAIIRDLYPGARAAGALGMLLSLTVMIPLAAPFVGGLITDHFSPMGIFVALGCWSLVATLLAFAFVPETHRKAAPGIRGEPLLLQYAQVLRSVDFLLPAGTISFSTSMFFAFMAGAPHIMVDGLGLSATEYGLCLVAAAGSFALGSFGTGMLASRIGTRRLIVIGVVIASGGGFVMFGGFLFDQVTVAMLVLTMAFSSVGHGFLTPTAMSRAVGAVPGLFGTASSIAGFLQIGTGTVMTALVGWLIVDRPISMGWTVLITSTLAALCAWGTLRRSAQAAGRQQ